MENVKKKLLFFNLYNGFLLALLSLVFFQCNIAKHIPIEQTANQYSHAGMKYKVELLIWEQTNGEKVVFVRNLPENYSLICQVFEQKNEKEKELIQEISLTFVDTLNAKKALLPFIGRQQSLEFSLIEAAPFWLGATIKKKVLLIDSVKDELLYSDFVKIGQDLTFMPSNLICEVAFVEKKDNTVLPALPYDEELKAVRYARRENLVVETKMSIDKRGIYHCVWKTKEGKTIERQHLLAVDEQFPIIDNPQSRMEALQYICSEEMFLSLKSHPNPDKAIEDFWLEKAGSYERANVLVNEFYTRVEQSNALFTISKEGWTSDRGLVFIVFGPPDGIIRSEGKERWYYYFEQQTSGEKEEWFTFIKNKKGEYLLQRSADYKTVWQMQQRLWHNGILN